MMASVTSRLINIFILTQDEMKHLPEKQPFDDPGRPRIARKTKDSPLQIYPTHNCFYLVYLCYACHSFCSSELPGSQNNMKWLVSLMAYNFSLCPTNGNEPVHEISNNKVCATSKASDQPAHMRSLIRAFASCLRIL